MENEEENGWPLGLQRLNVRVRLLDHFRFGNANDPLLLSSSSFLLSTPSFTSDSSSDLDTQSTGSFFPEKSRTLGSLIGLSSTPSTTNYNAVTNSSSSQQEPPPLPITSRRPHAALSLCMASIMGCAHAHVTHTQSPPSPSLAALLHLESRPIRNPRTHARTRRNPITHARPIRNPIAHARPIRNPISHNARVLMPCLCNGLGSAHQVEEIVPNNTLFANNHVLPPQPNIGLPHDHIITPGVVSGGGGASYISGDWFASSITPKNDFSGRNIRQTARRGLGCFRICTLVQC